MVSVVLLTTEEVLQRNSFWNGLDAEWVTEDMEPFEDVQLEHSFSKPISRDIYYAKYPDIPRSDSEEENSLSVSGFIRKHQEWRCRLRIRKMEARRHSTQSTFCYSSKINSQLEISKRPKSLEYLNNRSSQSKPTIYNCDDERVKAFMDRLLENVPPPPVEGQENVMGSILKTAKISAEGSEIELPNYSDFVNHKVQSTSENGPISSTLKRSKRKVSFSTESLKTDPDCLDSWYESIYGISDFIDRFGSPQRITSSLEGISWSDLTSSSFNNSILRTDSLSSEKLISQSHKMDTEISDLKTSTNEDSYEKFVVDKLKRSFKLLIPDSSSMDKLCDESNNYISVGQINNSLHATFYRLAPSDDEESPPENELQKNSDRVLSEHELRVQRSLASSLLQQAASSKASEEIQTSIKEVTSAIVHYVSGLEPANGDLDDRHPSPSESRRLFVESYLFIHFIHCRLSFLLFFTLRLEDWQDSQRSLNVGITKPSPGSTTLEDVLDSLLGLPSHTTRIHTPQPSPRKSSSPYYMLSGKSPRYEQLASSGHSSASQASRFMNTPSDVPSSFTDPSPDQDRPGKDTVDMPVMQESRRSRSVTGDHSRRRSEPFANHSASADRRTSLDATAFRSDNLIRHESKSSLVSLLTENSTDEAFVKCKYPKCSSRTPLPEAKRHYKTCHNCTTMYCSKECRRAHWEKHRKVCLHSRASALCRQIIAAAKEDADSLHQISTAAYQGYLAQGRGVVKVYFTSPEAAEKFTTHGYQNLSEPEFVKWSALQPNEMGVELYTEVIKLCKSYNPETRVILFVAVCILSEVPTKGAVKWERQMVSRCAKLRLSKTVSIAIQEQNKRRQRRDSKETPEDRDTLILTSKLCNTGEKHAVSAHKFREVCFKNICYELENRGVVLKKHFPEVYHRLVAYVDGTSERFIPMTIYPKDVNSGKSFMCVIMPDTDLDSGTPVDGNVMTIDVGVDSSKHQLSTPM
ncbi:unnamed protein product [Leptidea sinapis]|uniref:MYND-type domain-containing protein n=1 Tax=Leptidea sinapis TaxID=189913 RepID=A0A5E4R7Z2_9NEOP|nr:unnamed protein product [Leptidea sinapis]